MAALGGMDHDQAEALKHWWRAYGRWLLLALVLAAVAAGGMRYWQERQQTRQTAASAVYEQAMAALAQERGEAALTQAQVLRADYADTTYGVLGAFVAAQAALQQAQPKVAVDWLSWAMDQAKPDALRHLAQLRLARVRLVQGEAEQALRLLQEHPAGFEGDVEELRGDAYAATGNLEQARAAYQQALAQLDPDRRQLVEMKLAALEAAPDGAGTESSTEDEA